MDQEHKTMKVFVQLHLVPALLAMLVFFTTLPFLESAFRIYNRSGPAITWHSAHVVNRIVKPGDVLEIIYTLTVNKQCPSDLRAFIIAPDGTVPVRIPTIAGGYARPSDQPLQITVKVPIPRNADPGLAPLESGQHLYRATATRYCPDGVETDSNIPDAPFMLEVGNAEDTVRPQAE
jgi:hypothetical protein